MPKRIYFAAPLFAESERMYNSFIVERIRETFGERYFVYLPQENGDINDKTKAASSVQIYEADRAELRASDVLVVIIDGPVVDVGAASEIGWYAATMEFYNEDGIGKERKIIALFTDSRDGFITASNAKFEMMKTGYAESQHPYVNLFTVGAIKEHGKIVGSIDELITSLEELEFTE